MSGLQWRGVEINSIRYEAEKRGGESTGWPVDEGKWWRHEAAWLHALRRAAQGHGTVAVLLGARGGRQGTGRRTGPRRLLGRTGTLGQKAFLG
jgi:hypothetical protein